MTINNFFLVSSIIILLSGAASVIYPQIMFDMWGESSNQAGLIITQLSGALEIGLAVILWLSRDEKAGIPRRTIAIGGLITYALFTVIMLINVSTGMSLTVWLNIGLYLLLALGFGYFVLTRKT